MTLDCRVLTRDSLVRPFSRKIQTLIARAALGTLSETEMAASRHRVARPSGAWTAGFHVLIILQNALRALMRREPFHHKEQKQTPRG